MRRAGWDEHKAGPREACLQEAPRGRGEGRTIRPRPKDDVAVGMEAICGKFGQVWGRSDQRRPGRAKMVPASECADAESGAADAESAACREGRVRRRQGETKTNGGVAVDAEARCSSLEGCGASRADWRHGMVRRRRVGTYRGRPQELALRSVRGREKKGRGREKREGKEREREKEGKRLRHAAHKVGPKGAEKERPRGQGKSLDDCSDLRFKVWATNTFS